MGISGVRRGTGLEMATVRSKWFDWRPEVIKQSPNWRLVQN